MAIKESDLTIITSDDFSSNDKVRVLDDNTSRNITLSEFGKSIQSVLESLGFITTSSTPSNFTQTRKITTITADHVITSSDSVILSDTSLGNIIVTLPTAASIYNLTNSSAQQFTINKITTDTNTVTITPQGADLINGVANYVLSGGSMSTVTLITNGNDWFIV